jgi:hypothetical protein
MRPCRRRLGASWALALLSLLLAACNPPNPALAPAALLGQRPGYAEQRPVSPFPNAGAVVRAIWVPGLDAGFVPQGLALADGFALISGYGEAGGGPGSFGFCRVYRIDLATGEARGYFTLPDVVRHAGGLAYDGQGTLYVADTEVLVAVQLAGSLASPDHRAVVTGTAHLAAPLRGSFIAFDGSALWVGRYDRDAAQSLWRIEPAQVAAGHTLTEADTSGRLPVPALSQGAAFDARGRLWLSQSSSRLGRLQRADAHGGADPRSGAGEASYAFAPGVEGLAFAPDGTLWTVSEAGARRYQGWKAFHPLILGVNVNKLD